MKRLNGKVAVITGGNSGIGLATAKDFLAEGASVIITGRSKEAVDKAVSELGKDAYGIVSDTGDISNLSSLRTKVSALFPKIDILFINAGIGKFAPIELVDEPHFDEQFTINVKGAYFTIQQLLPLINDGGSIILNTSVNAHIGMANASVYSATKAALITFARTLSSELLPRKIRVNAISPGPVKTSILNKTGLSADQLEQVRHGLQSQVPLGRFGDPEEIAKVATFFASDDSSFVLGAELIADGGMATL
jgi:NAD(P)-dependent dehydrogenase (short-subunit alcohol dehydrogenase family)